MGEKGEWGRFTANSSFNTRFANAYTATFNPPGVLTRSVVRSSKHVRKIF